MRVLFATEKCILSAAKLLTHPKKKSRPSKKYDKGFRGSHVCESCWSFENSFD